MLQPALALLAASVALSLAACGGSGGGATGGAATGGGATGGAATGGAATGGTATGGTSTGGDAEPPDQDGMTALHNAVRAAVDPAADPPIPPLTWDADLAAFAKAHAEKCLPEHSGGPYGENIFFIAPGGGTPADAMAFWAGEVVDYDYATNSCAAGAQCGHYTQVVWRKTLRLGCGMAACTTGSPAPSIPTWEHWVCEYDPPGNWNGEKPY